MRRTREFPRRFATIGAGLAVLLLVGGSNTLRAQNGPARTGAAIYKDACQQCHGPNGRGVPAALLGLPVQPRIYRLPGGPARRGR